MSRLQAQWQRLYEPAASQSPTPPTVRTMVLELSRPADWPAVARLWQAVQEDMGLPAPGIAINGLDGYQLWFSLASPIATPQAVAFLEMLHKRYWAEIPPERIGIMPALTGHGGQGLKPLGNSEPSRLSRPGKASGPPSSRGTWPQSSQTRRGWTSRPTPMVRPTCSMPCAAVMPT